MRAPRPKRYDCEKCDTRQSVTLQGSRVWKCRVCGTEYVEKVYCRGLRKRILEGQKQLDFKDEKCPETRQSKTGSTD